MTRYLLGLAVFGSIAAAQQCTPPPSGMVAWYTGDGTPNDFFGKNNGTLWNGAGFASGMVASHRPSA